MRGDVRLGFIVGVPRSGTTLLRVLLNSHPDIYAPPESPWITGAYGGAPSFLDLVQYIQTDAFGAPANVPGVDPDHVGEAAADFVTGVYEAATARARAKWLVLKTPDDVRHLPRLVEAFPGAVFIQITRDPAAVVASTLATGWPTLNGYGETSSTTALRRWVDWERASRTAPPDGRLKRIRYERLVRRPILVCREICAHLGLDYHPGMLRFGEAAHHLPDWEAGAQSVKRHGSVEAPRPRPEAGPLALSEADAVFVASLGYSVPVGQAAAHG